MIEDPQTVEEFLLCMEDNGVIIKHPNIQNIWKQTEDTLTQPQFVGWMGFATVRSRDADQRACVMIPQENIIHNTLDEYYAWVKETFHMSPRRDDLASWVLQPIICILGSVDQIPVSHTPPKADECVARVLGLFGATAIEVLGEPCAGPDGTIGGSRLEYMYIRRPVLH